MSGRSNMHKKIKGLKYREPGLCLSPPQFSVVAILFLSIIDILLISVANDFVSSNNTREYHLGKLSYFLYTKCKYKCANIVKSFQYSDQPIRQFVIIWHKKDKIFILLVQSYFVRPQKVIYLLSSTIQASEPPRQNSFCFFSKQLQFPSHRRPTWKIDLQRGTKISVVLSQSEGRGHKNFPGIFLTKASQITLL